MTSIISKWQSLSKKEKMNSEEKNVKAEGTVVQMNEKNEIPGKSLYNIYCSFWSVLWNNRDDQQEQLIFYFFLSWAVADTAEVILLKALILQVIGLYQKVVPHLVNQCKFDFSKLLKGNTFFHGVHIWIICFGYEAGGFKQILELLMCFLIVQGLCQRKECGKKSPLFCSFKYCSWP